MSKKISLAQVTFVTASDYNVRPDYALMEIADYHALLDAMHNETPFAYVNWEYHKDNTTLATGFYYQGSVTTTIYPKRLYAIHMKVMEVTKGEL